ncbi:uncharacterized protein LOC143696903 [Siphateles boraxobius]|uniref:uncharacterized protein LOC143696903 n=1 Tax=Siphateles boraxobius TaxID=180520 RepID=UPI0040643C83
MEIFREKGLAGQLLADLLCQTKTTKPTDVRSLCLRGLPVILGDDPSAFFKTCSIQRGFHRRHEDHSLLNLMSGRNALEVFIKSSTEWWETSQRSSLMHLIITLQI